MKFFSKQQPDNQTSHMNLSEGYVPALPLESICHLPDYTHAIRQIRYLIALPDKYFTLFYLQPLNNFLLITQHCDRSLVINRLQGVVTGLKLRRSLILPKGVDPEGIREKKDIWTYSAFIALLMYDLPHLVKPIHYKRTDPQDKQVYSWHPVVKSIPSTPYIFKPADTPDLSRYLTPFLLHHLFDEHCLAWLCRDTEALNNAVESIVEPKITSSIGPLVIKVYNLVGNVQELEKGEPDSSTMLPPDNLDNPPPPPTPETNSKKPSSREMGRLFLNWLMSELSSNKLPAKNGHLIQHTPQGLALLTPTIFQYYATLEGHDWKQVQNGFIKLRLHLPNQEANGHFHNMRLPNGKTANVMIMPMPAIWQN